MRRLVSLLSLAALVALFAPTSVYAATDVNPNFLVSDADMTNTQAMSLADIDAFLSRGFLGSYVAMDVDGTLRRASDIIYRASQQFSLNPQFLLVLLQREQSLVESKAPSQNQLDWAMGYAVCDSCSKQDPALQSFRGFANQVYRAAERIRMNYLSDLFSNGSTLTGIGPGRPVAIDGVSVIPENNATSVLYTYTPHLHGNANFVRIWRRWFTGDYPTGTVLQDQDTGSIWLIQGGKRRAIRSFAALASRFSGRSPIRVPASVLESYEPGAPISFPNYSLLRAPNGSISLLVDDTLRAIDSMETFRSIGFSTDDIIDVNPEDLLAFQAGTPITMTSVMPLGGLLQDPTTGGIFYVVDEVKSPLFGKELLEKRFAGWTIQPAAAGQLDHYTRGQAVTFPDGTLIAVHGSPDVFIVSEGRRRHILDERTFLGLGFSWTDIVWTNERLVLEHALGEPISSSAEDIPSEPSLVFTAGL